MSTTDERLALVSARVAWNTFAPEFRQAAKLLAAIPRFKSVVTMMQSVANVAESGRPVLRKALVDEGIDLVALTPVQQALVEALAADLTARIQEFERASGAFVGGIMVERTLNKATIGAVQVVA